MPHLTLQCSAGGPMLDLLIGVSARRAAILQAQGAAVPAPVPVRALIDTGASCTCVDPSILQQLNLQPTGIAPMLTPTTGAATVSTNVYDVSMTLVHPQLQFTINAIPVAESVLLNQGFHVLFGRDMLAHCYFAYDGRVDCSCLRFEPPSPVHQRLGNLSPPGGRSIDVGVGAQVFEDFLTAFLVDHQIDAVAVVAALDAALRLHEILVVALPVASPAALPRLVQPLLCSRRPAPPAIRPPATGRTGSCRDRPGGRNDRPAGDRCAAIHGVRCPARAGRRRPALRAVGLMSVPRPAMFVAIVTRPVWPASATICASCSCCRALST